VTTGTPQLPKMKVLIGIVTRNRAELLPKAIHSALAQDYANKELVVLDIGSTDATPSLKRRFPQIRWQRIEERIGIPESRNRLMSNTDATYYFSLDDDAWFLERDEISLGVEYLETHRECAAIAYDILLPGSVPMPSRERPREISLFIGCGHLLRLSDVSLAGFYAPNPTVYGGSEELDLCMRLFAAGKRIVFLPGVHVWHERSAVGRNALEQYSHNVCNDFASLIRRCPLPDLAWMIPWRVVSHLRFAMQKRWFLSYLRGLSLLAGSLPSVVRSRSPLRVSPFRYFMRLRLATG